MIHVFKGKVCLDALDVGRRTGAALERRFGPRIGVLTILRPGVPLPTEEVRARASDDLRAANARTAVAATVIPGSGFAASAYRAAHSTMNLFARSDHPTKVTGSVDTAAGFLLQHLGRPSDNLERLRTAIAEAEAAAGGPR